MKENQTTGLAENMFMQNPQNQKMKVELHIWFPDGTGRTICHSELDEHLSQCFQPLPRDYDVPWNFGGMKRAMEQKQKRSQFLDALVHLLVNQVSEQVELKDPIRGYDREEIDEGPDMIEEGDK